VAYETLLRGPRTQCCVLAYNSFTIGMRITSLLLTLRAFWMSGCFTVRPCPAQLGPCASTSRDDHVRLITSKLRFMMNRLTRLQLRKRTIYH
jgi:hypothetical protein